MGYFSTVAISSIRQTSPARLWNRSRC